jgi:predicted transcriptional regulator
MRGFGELEAVIMDRMWAGEDTATVRDVLTGLQQDRTIAYTTVMTVMDNLQRKGWLVRERDGKAYRYRPTASREEYTARLMRDALDDSTDQEAVFTHFVGQMSDAEARSLTAVVRRLSRRPR